MPNLTQLRLEECPRPTAKGMEYDYRVYDGDKAVAGWRETRKRDYTEILFKIDTHGYYLRTDDINNAVAVARYPVAEHYAREAEKAARFTDNEVVRTDADGIVILEKDGF